MDEESVELSDVSEELDDELLLDSDCEDESKSEGSGSGLGLDFFDLVDQLGWDVFGLSVKFVRNDMVSGKDDTDGVSSKLVFSFLVFDLWLRLVFVAFLVFVWVILHEWTFESCQSVLSRLFGFSCRTLDRFLIVDGAIASGGKNA